MISAKEVFAHKFLNVLCVLRKEDKEEYYLIKTRKKKNEIKIIFSGEFEDREALEANLDSSYPVILLVDGKGILNKKIDLSSDPDVNWTNSIDWSSMHYNSFTQGDTKLFSICKKTIVEAELEWLKDKNYQVADFYVGSLTCILLKKWIDGSRLIANTTVFNFIGDQPVAILKSESFEIINYNIGEQSINENQIALYGAAVDFYVPQDSLDRSKSNLVNKEEVKYKKLFKSVGKAVLIGSFITLLFAYGITSFLSTEAQKLKQDNLSTNATYLKVQQLNIEKQRKLQILDEMGYSSSKFISQYIYELVKAVPDDVGVNQLNVLPLKNEIKDSKKVGFVTNTVRLACSTKNDFALNVLISQIKLLKWVDKVEVVSLKQDKKENISFEVKIFLKNV